MIKNKDNSIEQWILTALVVALVYVATTSIKLPSPTGGYVHPGDSIVFFSIFILGWKKGALASGTGAALADLLSGYGVYVPGTFVIKALMVVAMGLVLESTIKITNSKKTLFVSEIFALILAGIVGVFGYFVYAMILHGGIGAIGVALKGVIGNIGQETVGILLCLMLQQIFENTILNKKLIYKLKDK